MNIRRLERRVREWERQRVDERQQAHAEWERRFVVATLQPLDTELDELTRPLALLQAWHGPDSPEAQAEYERIRADFERIIETRYASFLDEPIA